MKDNENNNRQRLTELTRFYENQLTHLRNNNTLEENLMKLYDR